MKAAPLVRPTRFFFFAQTAHGQPVLQIRILGEPIDTSPFAPGAISVASALSMALKCVPQRWADPEPSGLAALVQTLNIIRQTDPPDRTEPRSLRRITGALAALIEDLPRLVELNKLDHARAAVAGTPTFYSGDSARTIECLLVLAQQAQRIFPASTSRNVRHEQWHDAAQAIALHAQGMWSRNGAGAGRKATSPVTKLTAALLPLAGCGVHEPEAIARAMNRV